MKRLLGGVLGLIIFAVIGFVMIGSSQQTELLLHVPPGVKAYIDGKRFKPCKHEDVPKGQGCDAVADVERHFRWFVNGGKTYRISVRTPEGEAVRDVKVGESMVSLRVELDEGRPVFVGAP